MASAVGSFTIKHVVDRLSGTYPNLTASKIRFLEDQGLVSPARSASGYRLYREEDIARIEAVLHMQKTHYYPLSVIKTKLKSHDAGEQVEEMNIAHRMDDIDELAGQKHAIETIPHLLNVEVSFVRMLVDCGLMALSMSPKGRALVDGADLALIRAAAELNRFGIDPRHLRVYSQSVNRESLVFEQVLSSVASQAKAEAQEEDAQLCAHTFEHLVELTAIIRKSLLERELSKRFDI